jgi:probable selenium-dependent hydroxylase accessory protein YqeC
MHYGIVEALDLSFPCVLAVVGCGGKTSFIERIANSYQSKMVLVSPTAKMYPLKLENAHCHGVLNTETGKLEALPAAELASLTLLYDITVLEADGSRSLPCKGWLKDEPVIPRYCTHTVGIVTLIGIGKAATEEVVHNLPRFLALTGLRDGQEITMQALQDMVCAPNGMFKNSAGSRILLVNQVEDQSSTAVANKFLLTIKKSYPGFFSKLLFGSVRDDIWQEV